MEATLPLLIGLLSAAVLAVVWRFWSRRREEPAHLDPRPTRTSIPRRADDVASPGAVATEDVVARMRNRSLEEVGAGRALPRTARTTGICPRCGRTLQRGRRRCAGCGAWLVDGVPARRAGAFVARGAAIGVLIGLFGGLFLASLASRNDPGGVAATTRTPEETAGPVPAGVRAALDGMLAVGSRLAAARDGLAAALAEPAPDAASLGGQLRAVDAEAAEAVALSAALDRWPGSRELAGDIRSFNVAVREAAAPGLRGDAAAASAAGNAVIEALTGLEAVNARTVDAARDLGLLPPSSPLSLPATPRSSSPGASASPGFAAPSPTGG